MSERVAHTSTRAPLDPPRPPTADYVSFGPHRARAFASAVTARTASSPTAVSTAGTTAVALARGGVALARASRIGATVMRARPRVVDSPRPRATRRRRRRRRGERRLDERYRALFRRFEEAESGKRFC